MREKKKTLRLNKFAVANLNVLQQLKGGTDSNPCQADTDTTSVPSHQQPTGDDHTCRTSEIHYPSNCTKGQYISNEDVENCRG